MTRADIADLLGWVNTKDSDLLDRIERIVRLAEASEREACARIADTYGGPKEPMMVGTYEAGWHNAAETIAADIRARGNDGT